jgi:hypothetical protein
VAALGGLTMNMSYMLAGSASVNPVLALAAGIVLVGRDHASVIAVDGVVSRLLRYRPLSALRLLRAEAAAVRAPVRRQGPGSRVAEVRAA